MNYFIHWINTDIMNSLTLVFFQTKVISILNGTSNGDLFARGWVDDKEDPNVGSLFQLIREDPKKTLRSSDARYQR